jgi:hypothetical protein
VLGFLAKIKEISETLFKIIHASLIHVFKAKAKFENRLIWQNVKIILIEDKCMREETEI